MATSVLPELPRWALVLFDVDGCTMIVKTSSFQTPVSEGDVLIIEVSKVPYKVEILKLAESKSELDDFEIEWQTSTRSEAIAVAKDRHLTAGYIAITGDKEELTLSEFSADSFLNYINNSHLGDIATPETSPQPPSINEEVRQLKERQHDMIKNQAEMMGMLSEILGLLKVRFRKRQQLQLNLMPVTQPLTSEQAVVCEDSKQAETAVVLESVPVEIPSVCAHSLVENMTQRSSDKQTELEEPILCDSPLVENITRDSSDNLIDLEEPAVRAFLLGDITEPSFDNLVEQVVFPSNDSTEHLNDLTLFQDLAVPISNHAQPLSTINMEELSSLKTPLRPNQSNSGAINIGTNRNPIYVDRLRFHKKKQMPTATRFILGVMDLVFSTEELATSSIEGGTVKYRGQVVEKHKLSETKLSAIYRQAAVLYGLNEDDVRTSVDIRNAINAKCRAKRQATKKAAPVSLDCE